jgi:hypothetical protein
MSAFPIRAPALDPRDAYALAREALVRRSGYLPGWLGTIEDDDPDRLPRVPDAAYLWILARYVETLLRRLDQAPEKNRLAFLETLGIELIPAQPARAPVVFRTSPDAPDHHLPAGTRLMAPPPPESSEQVSFEVERGAGLAAAQLRQVFSLWPGRDQYIDHTPVLAEGPALYPFRLSDLRDTAHHLYVAHERLLELNGHAAVDVELELVAPASERLDLVWEYWDGKVWRGFSGAHPLCGERERVDGTDGLLRSGVVRVRSECAESQPTVVAGIESSWIRGRVSERILPGSPIRLPEVAGVRLRTRVERPLACAAEPLGPSPDEVGPGLHPDTAIADGAPVDLSAPFYPMGEQPGPGSTFYFALDEAFGRPGAEVTICLTRAETPQDHLEVATEAGSAGTVLSHLVAWEYWDGSEWRPLIDPYENTPVAETDPRDFTEDGVVRFTIPDAIRRTEVDGEEAFWLRVRLLSGGFGFTQRVTWLDTSDEANPVRHEFTYVVTRPPALRDLRVGYVWQDGPHEAEHVVTYNDFQYEDRTDEARWEGATFRPFRPVRDITPGFYLGFDRRLPVSRLGILFDIVEPSDAPSRPELVWEYWNGSRWSRLAVEDGTRDLGVTGILSFIGPGDSVALARFGEPLHWVRGRLKEDGPPGTPEITGVHPNAVWAVQRETITDEPLGTSDGLPNQVATFPRAPVLAGERIEVLELEGARANVEWRVLAAELFEGDLRRVRELEEGIQEEGPAIELADADLRLVRDRERKVVEAWVRWEGRRHLHASGPNDRHYTIERGRGRVRFGDGIRGRIPPEDAQILGRLYRSGGGRRGNVPARAITQAAAGLGGVEELFNPLPGSGGAESETLRRVASRGARTIRHRGRAVRGLDYETMAKEASAAVAVARAIPLRDPAGRHTPGWVTLLVIPESSDTRPWPSFQLREQVRRYISERAGPHAGSTLRLHVAGPTYYPVDVRAEIVPRDADLASAVEEATRTAVERFLHPLRGGPAGEGWTMGRDVFLSDLAAELERVQGVDHLRELSLLAEEIPQGERLRVPEGQVVAAGNIAILMRG